uniref:Uncharacterized protein n=1 Tax=Nelumbo nucifera TaxID=4432 RepID=A0A822ZNP9_NELNU|nr:TPA_asm: hypothetical protein HUJ06_004320 [Nelumbo nucifera]
MDDGMEPAIELVTSSFYSRKSIRRAPDSSVNGF